MQSSSIITPTVIETPFALNGDKNIPSQTASGTDTSSIDEGFLPITQVNLNDGGSAPERKDFNGMFYLSTDQRVYLQNGGLITFDSSVSTAIGGYPKGAILGYLTNNGLGFVESCIEDNTQNFITNPTLINGTVWKYSHLLNIDNDIVGSVVQKEQDIYSGSLYGSSNLDRTSVLTNYLPNDSNKYLVLVSVSGQSGSTVGDYVRCGVNAFTNIIQICAARTWGSSYYAFCNGSVWVPVGANRKFEIIRSTAFKGSGEFIARAYWKVK